MREVNGTKRSRRVARALLIGTVGLAAAGCSSEVTRFSQPLFGSSSETRYTGSITPSPTTGVQRQSLDAPGGKEAGAPGQSSNGNVVTVQQGDTVHSIARANGVPPDALMQANNLGSPDNLRPGQHLIIPTHSRPAQNMQARQPQDQGSPPTSGAQQVAAAPVSTPAPTTEERPTAGRQGGGSHQVNHGETVFSIARAYNVSPNDIIRANSLDSPNQIRVGQSLTIPGAAGATQTAGGQPQVQPAVQRQADSDAQSQGAEGQGTGGQLAQAEIPEPAPVSLTTGGEERAEQPDTSAGVADPAPLASGTFRWPVRGRVISGFGDSSDGATNDGVKISVPEGSSVRAAENGVVAYAGDELQGYGNLVLIRHDDDWVSAYAHNSEISVSRGDQVQRGQVIAKAGQTGSVSSPQLHFELRKGSQPVDPLRHLSEN